MRICYFLSLFLLFVACSKGPQPIIVADRSNDPETLEKPYVVMVSFDGFRYDYAAKYGAENFLEVARQGVTAASLIPSYPSKTFPNHYTLATGCYPARHGLVNNTFYDPTRKETYKTRDRDKVEDGSWYGGTPLWVLAEQQGMLSASFFWVGSEADVQGIHPTYHYQYDGSIPNQYRVDQVIEWLKLPEAERPHLIFLYFSLVDDDGHNFGPDSEELIASVHVADELLGNLRRGLRQLKLPVNLVLVSDHGMIRIDNKNPINPSKIADLSGFEQALGGPFLMLYHEDSTRIAETYTQLKENADRYQVYLRDSIPEHLHFRDNARIGDILLMAEAPAVIETNPQFRISPGTHGFDPAAVPEMGAIFYAEGPALEKGVVLPPTENIHIYPLVAHILGLEIGEIDGSLDIWQNSLK